MRKKLGIIPTNKLFNCITTQTPPKFVMNILIKVYRLHSIFLLLGMTMGAGEVVASEGCEQIKDVEKKIECQLSGGPDQFNSPALPQDGGDAYKNIGKSPESSANAPDPFSEEKLNPEFRIEKNLTAPKIKEFK